MGMMRSVLLAGSQSVWLRESAMRYPFVRRSVSRFMPGERLEDALGAAGDLQREGVGTILTHLGENLTDLGQAGEVTRHYLQVLDQVAGARLDAQISVKLTQLGLDLDAGLCFENLMALVKRAEASRNLIWIDMESSGYVDVTLELFRRARVESPRVGVCLQAYLRRTAADLESLLPLGPAIRLVKGAYMEPPDRAFPRKRDVDENYFALAARFLGASTRVRGALLGIATHDPRLVDRLQAFVASAHVPPAAFEFEMLYGIQRGLQRTLRGQGRRLRVLISYGEHWFPWYMRRLAERPANVLFVMKNVLAG